MVLLLSQGLLLFVTDTPIADSDGGRRMWLQVMGYELRARSDEARNSGSWERRGEELRRWEQHRRMKTDIKIKETRWGETRILD